MFVSLNQFYVFLFCVSIGAVSGIVYSVFKVIKKGIKSKMIKAFFDVLFFILLSAFYIFVSFKAGFPNFRFYMPVGVLAGLIAYVKSFDFILAKYLDLFYNIIRSKVRRKTNEGRRNEKRRSRKTKKAHV